MNFKVSFGCSQTNRDKNNDKRIFRIQRIRTVDNDNVGTRQVTPYELPQDAQPLVGFLQYK